MNYTFLQEFYQFLSTIIIIVVFVVVIISFHVNCSHHSQLVGVQWSVSESKCPQLSSTLLRIVADVNNFVVRIVSIFSLISNSFSPLSKHLATVPSAPSLIGITVTLMFYSFLSYLARSKYFCFLLFSLCVPPKR